MRILLFGGKGWIGDQLCEIMSKDDTITVVHGVSRCDDESALEKEIIDVKPDRLVSLIGRTSGPGCNTIDYLEQKGRIRENVRDNLYGPIILALLAKKYDIHFTYMGTGCIFSGYPDAGYDEEAKPDFFGSGYSVVKGFTDRLMHQFESHVLNVRIRMPISAQVNKKNFITKIMTYEKICSIPNSMTVLPELLPIMVDMVKRKQTGTINLSNPGLISHNEILEMVKEIVDPNFTWQNFSLEDQDKVLVAGRSNNKLNTDKLTSLYPQVRPIKEAVKATLMAMRDAHPN